jgi:superfamily II DNA/RNA helicase
MQIGSVIEKLAQYLPYIKIAYAVRDPTISKRANRIDGQILPEPIAIGTLGTVEDWCCRLRVINLSQLRICCIDEADFMIVTNNFQQTCVNIVLDLNRSNCQIMLFSATYSDEMMVLAREIVPNPFVLILKREKQTLVNIRQFFIRCYEKEQKYNAIEKMYASLTVGQAIIFCRTKETALDLVVRMEMQKHSVREIMSILDIEQRKAVIEDFRKGDFRVLISTDIAARGKFISIRLR